MATLVILAGCGAGVPGPEENPSETTVNPESSTATPTDSPTSSATASPAPPPVDNSVEADPWHAVSATNEWNQSITVTVRVVRVVTSETVQEVTLDLAPGESQYVYDTASADPDGIESFRVIVTTRNRTAEATIETSTCYGDVTALVRTDGSLRVQHGIC